MSEQKITEALSSGRRVYCRFRQYLPSDFNTADGTVSAVNNECVLVLHWTDKWYRIDDPAIEIGVYGEESNYE